MILGHICKIDTFLGTFGTMLEECFGHFVTLVLTQFGKIWKTLAHFALC